MKLLESMELTGKPTDTEIFRTLAKNEVMKKAKKGVTKHKMSKSGTQKGILARFDTKLPKEQKERFEYAAMIGGYRTLTDFLISSAQQKANEIILQHETFLMHEQDRKSFFEALSIPAKPGKNLVKAAKRLQSLLVDHTK